MAIRTAVFDNPILRRHVRSQLRRQELIPPVIVAIVLSACAVWLQAASPVGGTPFALEAILWLQALLLFVLGTSDTATAVAQARRSGMLDFHRISPVNARDVCIGFVLGAPLRVYTVTACTVPFSLAVAAMSAVPAGTWLLCEAAILLTAVLWHTFGAIQGLVGRQQRGAGGTVVVAVVLVHLWGAWSPLGYLTPMPTVIEALHHDLRPGSAEFCGVALPRFAITLLHQVPLLAFGLLGVSRRCRYEGAFTYSKAQAVAFSCVLGVLIVGNIPVGGEFHGFARPVGAYASAFVAIVLGAAVTPSAGQLARGMRRARKLGLAAPSQWSDLAHNGTVVAALCCVAVCVQALAVLVSGSGVKIPAIALGPLTSAAVIAYFCLGLQYLVIRLPKAGLTYTALAVFLVWVLPMIVGAVLEVTLAGSSSLGQGMAGSVMALSPLYGISCVTGDELRAPGIVAVVTSLALALLTICLRVEQDRAVRAATR